MSSLLDAFKQLNEQRPFDLQNNMDPDTYKASYIPSTETVNELAPSEYVRRYTNPDAAYYYDYRRYVEPMASIAEWGFPARALNTLDAEANLPAIVDRLDPNKIFSADIQALKSIEADQSRVVKVFEKRVLESLNDKNKYGLTEEDIEALSALTSARNVIAAIRKEQINVRKNIADIKLKQMEKRRQSVGADGGTETQSSVGSPSAFDVGRSMLDKVFDLAVPIPTADNASAPTVPDDAYVDISTINVDELLPTVSTEIKFEPKKPETFVRVGDNDSSAEFVTLDSDGIEIPDYPKPTTAITKIDREAGVAIDEIMNEYPLKVENYHDIDI